MTKRVAIAGGGTAGIYTAWRLLQDNGGKVSGDKERHFDIHLYESENRPATSTLTRDSAGRRRGTGAS